MLFVERIPIGRGAGAASVASQVTSGWGNRGPATWQGHETTLAAFDARQGREVTQGELEAALGGDAARSTAVLLRYVAPSGLASTWREASETQRAKLDRGMVAVVDRATERLTSHPIVVFPPASGRPWRREAANGFAIAAAVKASPGAYGAAPRLEARAVVLGVETPDGEIVSPSIPDVEEREWVRAANNAAHNLAMGIATRVRGPWSERPVGPIGPQDLWIDDRSAVDTEVELANRVERAVANPGPDLLADLGPAPEQDRRKREHWDGLARDLAWSGVAGETYGRDAVRPYRDYVERQVGIWREQEGLGRERDDPGPDIGM